MSVSPNVNAPAPTSIPWWQRRGNTAQWISAVAACIALIGFLLQLNAIRANAREANARQLYGAYMEAGLKYPQFLRPDYEAIKADPTKLTQYRWFVSYFLFAYDDVFHALGEEGWVQAFRAELRPHLPLLCSEIRAQSLLQYYSRTADIVKDEIRAAKSTVPECAHPQI
ncbi:MAG TPA: hypothetical protein VNQ50_04750 [Xanthobacteraceae bacterium]|jgi:hypothetical protein|nr:hypothetical protein [Xanthobacteraceae bacterium]